VLVPSSFFGVGAAVLQILGYALYAHSFLSHKIRPNSASFVMFAYGTSFLTFLEWKNGATWPMLALPVACSLMSIGIALLCLRRGATERTDTVEAFAFGTDLWMTVLYGAILFAGGGNLAVALSVSFGFLLASNLTTLTSFFPLVRSTYRTPARELTLPWLVWTAAYLYLTLATLMDGGWENPVLLIYPIANLILHALVAALSMRKAGPGEKFRDGVYAVSHRPSAIHGTGMFADRDYAPGETIWRLSGRPVVGSFTNEDPNCVGFGPDIWIDPDPPFDCVNHCCEPNAAFGRQGEFHALVPIVAGDEVTMDYSMTEADPEWQMQCGCGATNCRKWLYAIQISFADEDFPPRASPGMQQVWRNSRVSAAETPALKQLAGRKKEAVTLR
jgi:hypothetical protein